MTSTGNLRRRLHNKLELRVIKLIPTNLNANCQASFYNGGEAENNSAGSFFGHYDVVKLISKRLILAQ